jgi:tetratricopeptide (TPR) repeat protein
MKYRFSVFWVRGDQFTNFAADLSHILTKLDQTAVETKDKAHEPAYLRRTLMKLEETCGSWLMILDNADDLDEFRGKTEQDMCVSNFIPQKGRILITTRDQRFQGLVAGAHDGQRVDPMDNDEAKCLLLKSIPEHLSRVNSKRRDRAAQELLEELGNLPLAVAQAAANIVDQHLSLTEYVSLYRDKKRRMGLMKSPVRDYQSKDPRHSSQSILVTWELSFEHLQKRNPLSVTLISYLGCFHWRGIPKRLVSCLPEFQELDPSAFQQVVKGPLHLSLVDESERTGSGTYYSVHPLVNDRAIDRLTKEEAVRYLTPCIDLLINEDSPLIQDWIAHAVRQVELGESFAIVTGLFATLLRLVASFFLMAGLAEHGSYLATRSLNMATAAWNHDDPAILRTRKVKICCLNASARYLDAEIECQLALESLGFGNIQAEFTEDDLELERTTIEGYLAKALGGLKRYKDVERVHRRQLQSKAIRGDPTAEAYVKHNLAHALRDQGALEEARIINDELLAWSESAEGREVVPRSLYLVMMNLKAHIRADASSQSNSDEYNHDEILKIYLFVYHESLELLGPANIDTWKGANNALSLLLELQRYDEAAPILKTLLTACVSANIRVEGAFAKTFSITWSQSLQYLTMLRINGKENEIIDFLDLLFDAEESAGLGNINPCILCETLNVIGVVLQQHGLFEEAEKYHRRALSIYDVDWDTSLLDVIYYNVMLAMARQGRVAQAFAFRKKQNTEITRAEGIHGPLEQRLERDRNDQDVYKQADDGLLTGTIQRGDTWWTCHQDILNRTERRYGHLDVNDETEKRSTIVSPHRTSESGTTKASFWRRLLGKEVV